MIKKVFLQATICLLLAACSNDPNPLVTGYGDVRFLLSVDPSVTPVAGAAGIDVDAPSADALALSAMNCRTATVKSWASLAKFESGSQKLPVGEYIFSASYGDKDQEGFIAPTFFAEQPNCVKEDEETTVDIKCGVAQTLVSVSFTDAAKNLVDNIMMRAKTASGEYVDFTTSEKRTACLRPGNMRCELAIADASGRKVALQPFDAFAADAATHHQFRFDADGNILTCVYDEHTASTPYRLTVDDALFSTQSPTITAVGFDNDNSYSMLEYNSPDKRLGVDINVAGGLRNLYFTVISNNMDDNYWTAETDIAATDAATLASQGITATGLEKGATNASLDLSAIVARMHASESGAATVHKIILQARDEAGRVALSPMVLTVEIRPVKIALIQPAAIRPSADKVALEIECSGDLPADKLTFETKGPSSLDQWQEVTAANVKRVAVGRYTATLPLAPGISATLVRASYNDGLKYTEPVAVERDVPEYKVMCSQENIWSSQVDLMFEGDDLSEVVPYISVLVKPNGGGWHPAVTERNVADRRVTVKTLTPSTSYEIAVISSGNDSHGFGVTTESALELPNADFEDIDETISMKHVNCGGKYSNLSSWMPIYNKADIIVSEPKKWASVNKKTCAKFASTSNTWFQVPTTEIIPSTGSGQWAVRLRNAAWSWHGVEPARDARTDRHYYSSYAPTLANRSAGKLFLGSYSVDKSGLETYNEGIAFRSRPTAVSGIYTFVQDYHDTSETGLVVISLVNDEGGKEVEIGRGVGYLKPSTSFTRFNVPVVYSIRNKRATRLKLMVASSNHASYSIEKESRNIKTSDYLETAVSTGAELTVDQLSLLYE